MDSLMNKIDSVKEKLTDKEYKELCDTMVELNKKENEESDEFYKVWYINVCTRLATDPYKDTCFTTKIRTTIVKMSKRRHNDLSYIIDKWASAKFQLPSDYESVQDSLQVFTAGGGGGGSDDEEDNDEEDNGMGSWVGLAPEDDRMLHIIKIVKA